MLILSRKLGQSLIIDNDITVTILSIRNGQIRIGIDAPVSVPVLREELVTHPRTASGTARDDSQPRP